MALANQYLRHARNHVANVQRCIDAELWSETLLHLRDARTDLWYVLKYISGGDPISRLKRRR